MRPLYLRTQADLLSDIENSLIDTTNARWSNNQIYRAINVALESIAGRVQLPRLYTISGGFTTGTYEYTIPAYVGDNFVPMVQVTDTPLLSSVSSTNWVRIPFWDVEPSATGTRTMRLSASPYTAAARLIWYAPNGPVPYEDGGNALPKLAATMTTSTATILLDGLELDIYPAGWVKIDNEWMSYTGVTHSATATTLSGVLRAQYNTTAATHDGTGTPATVYFGVAVDDTRLWRVIRDLTLLELHLLQLHRGTNEDRGNHERIMGFLETRCNNFWRTSGYIPERNPAIKPDIRWW